MLRILHFPADPIVEELTLNLLFTFSVVRLLIRISILVFCQDLLSGKTGCVVPVILLQRIRPGYLSKDMKSVSHMLQCYFNEHMQSQHIMVCFDPFWMSVFRNKASTAVRLVLRSPAASISDSMNFLKLSKGQENQRLYKIDN